MSGQHPAPDLATPIRIALQHPTIAGPDPQAAAAANAKEFVRAYAERDAKLELLFSHYGLARTGNDGADYRALALRMATDRFRGFEVVDVNAPKSNYEHRRGNWVSLMMLLADVATVKRGHLQCSDGQAIRALPTRFPERWGDFRTKLRTLANWLGDARNKAKNPGLLLWQMAEAGDHLPAMIEVFGSTSRKLKAAGS